MTENEAIEELLYQEDMRGKGIDYQVNNLVIAASVKALREIQQYKAIGTAEECREAMEKQRGKKPLIKSKNKGKIQIGDYVYVKCSCCEEDIFHVFIIRVLAEHKNVYFARLFL